MDCRLDDKILILFVCFGISCLVGGFLISCGVDKYLMIFVRGWLIRCWNIIWMRSVRSMR